MSRLTKKFASVGIAIATIVVMSGASPAKAQSVDINALLAQIAQLQGLVAQLQAAQGGSVSASYTFTRNLTVGSKGDDVKALQQFLNANGYQLSVAGAAGSSGMETTTFGPATKAALAKFQATMGISPAVGYFGPITRTKVASMGGTPNSPIVVPATQYLKVEAAGPVANTIPDGSLYNKVLILKFSAGSQNEQVTGVTVTRGGYVGNTKITGVSVWDDIGNRYGNIISALTADGKATISFPSTPFSVPAGQSKYLTVSFNLDADTGSGLVGASVAAVSDISASVAVTGTFPVVGQTFTIVDGANSLADLRIDDQSVAGLVYSTISSADGNLEVGNINKEVFKLRLTQNNSKEAVNVSRVVLYVEGTVQEAKDITNWKLYSPEGNVLATAEKPVDRFVTFVLSTPYVLDKGLSKDLSVKADVADGSGNYFRVSVQNDYDIVATGATTGASVQPVDSAGTTLTAADTQNTNGGFKVKAGALTVSKMAGSPSGNVAPSSQNVVLAKFDLKAAGEKLEIRKMGLQIEYAAAGLDLTGTVSVKDTSTGETYLSVSADTSNLQATSVTAPYTANQMSLSSYITVESGQTKSIEVTGTIDSSATSTSNYKVSLGGFYVKRYSTNDYTDVATGEYEANQLSVSDVTLSVTKDTSFGNAYRSAGSTNVKIAQFVLQASDADDIRINSVSFSVASSSYIQNMKLKDGTTELGSTIGTPSATGNSYTTNFVITKSASKVLAVYADVLSNATTDDDFVVSVTDSGVSGYGVASSKSLSDTPSSDTAGQTVSVKTASLTIAADAAKPLSKIVLAGQIGVELSKIKLESSNEDLTLKKFTLSIGTASTTQWAAATDVARNISKVYVYDGTKLLNTGGTSVVSGDVVLSGLELTLAQNTPKVLTIKADISGQDTVFPKAVGRVTLKSTSTTDMEVYSSQGRMETGITVSDTNAPSNYMLFTVAAPVITNTYSGSTTKSGQSGDEVARFTISNPGTRDLSLSSTTITISLTPNGATSTVDTWRIYESGDLSNALDTDATSLASASATSTTITFDSFTTAQTVTAGGSKTYVIKANTASIKTITSTYTGDVKLSVKLDGSTGYLSTDVASSPSGEELLWNDGVVLYSYSTTGAYAATYSNLLGSDSGEVLGPTLTY